MFSRTPHALDGGVYAKTRCGDERVDMRDGRDCMLGVDGTRWQHLQVVVRNLLQKLWDWFEERTPMLKHGSVVRMMYFSNSHIKDVVR